jgi:hypothetical protein
VAWTDENHRKQGKTWMDGVDGLARGRLCHPLVKNSALLAMATSKTLWDMTL